MSFNILGDHNLDIDIRLIKNIRKVNGEQITDEIEQVVDIELSSINSLQIDDNLMRMGLYGVIEINNKANILDTIGINNGQAEDLYIAISIKDLELQKETGLKPHQIKVEFLGLVEKTTTASANFEDNLIMFEFEEAIVADMHHTSWDQFTSQSEVNNISANVVEIVNSFYENTWKDGSDVNVQEFITAESDYEPDIKIPVQVNTKRNNDSVHDVVSTLLKRTQAVKADNGNDAIFHLPSFRFSNTPKGRLMTFKPYFTDRHRALIEEVREEGISLNDFGVTNPTDYSDVYTEKFTFGPFAQLKGFTDPNTNWHNSIEGETVTRPDTGTLMEDKWSNYYMITSAEDDLVSTTNLKIIPYVTIAKNFIQNELGLKKNAGINLPLINPKHQKKTYFYNIGDLKDSSTKATRNEIYNKVTKSFVTVNEQIEFESKGAIYRTPGKFIWIERTKKTSELENLWYVNSVQHSIVDGRYTTKIIANSVFGDKTINDYNKLFNEVAIYLKQEERNLQFQRKEQEVKEATENLQTAAAPTPPQTYPT
tara:strand:+ start:30 stop:1643 length:1614 start_codon:yes stop_codon:yes gene_type:complete